jgi:hypothetical protein
MRVHIADSNQGHRVASILRPYAKTPLVQLVGEIINRRERQALLELHENRPVFRSRSGRSVLMAEFILELKDSDLAFRWCGRDPVVVDQAYDLTLAKFHDLPIPSQDGGPAEASEGPDCCFYYRAWQDYLAGELRDRPCASPVAAELRAADALERMVKRHFHLSCLECRRRAAKLVRRYTWKVNGDQLVLWLPVEMSGRRCRAWLQENVLDPDPGRPGERDRIQALVDRLLSRRRILSLDRLRKDGTLKDAAVAEEPLTSVEEIPSFGLAGVIAEEKAENIEDQRPAIRAMGPERLKELIRTVFEALAEDRYHAERIAAAFGLSKATFSRFAGCEWSRSAAVPDTASIPDLYRNTARVLANHEDFVAVARGAGVWGRVCQVAGETGRGEGETE